MSMNYKTRLKDIDTLIFDVDGVFTDNTLYILEGEQPMRKMNVKDGYALQLVAKKGYRIAIITGGRSEAVKERFESLGVQDIFLGSSNKSIVFDAYVKEHGIDLKKVLYMGDDVPDLPVMRQVGLPCCPQDATEAVKAICSYISPIDGGRGCVRDVLEQMLKVKGEWMVDTDHVW